MEVETDRVSEVVARLQALDKTSSEIALEAGVTESWLKMLRRGKIPNPGVQQFDRVVAYLARANGSPPQAAA